MELLKLLSTNELVAQIIGFLFLFFILRAFFWRKILKILDDRKEKIASGFQKIEDTRKEVAQLRGDYESRIASIDEEIKSKLKNADEQAKVILDNIRRKAEEDAQKVIQDARNDVKYELTQVKEELKQKIVELTISAAESVIQERLSEETDKKLARDFLDKADSLEEL